MIVSLPWKLPVDLQLKGGWGCFVCGIRGGAVAVICDVCAQIYEKPGNVQGANAFAWLKFFCGGSARDIRVPIEALDRSDANRIAHDQKAHERDEATARFAS